MAPLGVGGLLVANSSNDELATSIWSPQEGWVNVYKVASLGKSGRSDVVAGAVRRKGLMVALLPPPGEEPERPAILSSASELDMVDVCSIGTPAHPHALAGLGADGTIHFWANPLLSRQAQVFRFGSIRGVAYSLRHADGHILLLTSEAIYVVAGLAERFLAGDYTTDPLLIDELPVQAVDIYVAQGKLFIVHPDGTAAASPISAVAARAVGSPADDSTSTVAPVRQAMTESTREPAADLVWNFAPAA